MQNHTTFACDFHHANALVYVVRYVLYSLKSQNNTCNGFFCSFGRRERQQKWERENVWKIFYKDESAYYLEIPETVENQ